MAAYRADIEIGVKGIQQLQAITKQINTLSTGVDSVNKRLAGASQSLNAYNANLAKAAATLNKVNAGTVAEADAVRQYVQALGQANAARDRQNRLIQQQIALQRKAVPTANAGFGLQGPALPPAAGTAARTSRGIGGRLGGAVSGAVIGGVFPLLFGQSGGAAAGGAIGGLLGGLAGPGGGFAGSLLGTLIGDIASRGQAVKQLGEDLGFSAEQTKQLAAAFKTANTDVEKFTAVIQNVRGLGLELEDQAKAVQLITTLTEKYGGSFEKTGSAITSALESGKVTQATLNQLTSQGINIQGELADKYGVSRDAILKMAKDGDISVQTLIDTLVKMGNEGVAAVNKPKTAMERLTASVSALGQSLAGLATTLVRAFGPALQWLTDRVTDFVNAVSRAISRLADLMSGGRMAQADIQAARSAETATQRKFGILGGIRALNPEAQKYYENQKQLELRRLVPGAFAPAAPAAGRLRSFNVPSQAAPSGGAGAKGPKPPEDRTALLQEDLEAMKLMSVTQDGIRDALFEGNKELAIRLEYDQKVADINRDAAKALLNANYETEKVVIKAQEIVRLKDAELEREDKLRELARDREMEIKNIMEKLDMELIKVGATTDVKKQAVQYLEIENGLKAQGITLTDADKEAIRNKIAQIQKLTKEQEAANAKLQMEKDLFEGISSTVASTFSGAIDAAVKGTENLGDALKGLAGDLLATIGKMMIMYGIAQALGAAGGSDGVGVFSFLAKGFGFRGAKDGAYWPGGFEAFAQGGVVTSPTMGLIGEGGEPEYVIPQSKMSAAMSRYSRGARGESVIPGSGTSAQGSNAATATVEPIDVRYSVERINNVEYVTADQFRAGMAQAAQQGAIQGERRAMRTLTNSAAARGRLGI